MSPWLTQIRAITDASGDNARIAALPNGGCRIAALLALDNDRRLLHCLRLQGPLTIAGLIQHTGPSENCIRDRLSGLIRGNKVLVSRDGRPMKYEAINQLPPH